MPFDSALDPTSEYTSLGFALLTQLLVRPLMSYRHVEGPAGADVVPDLAAAMPEVSDDGTTYSFRIRDGVRFGPPLDRPVTSADVAFAFERAADPEIGSPYRFYFTSAIEGMQAVSDGDASSITGIETPDAETIVFHLTQPTGDFLDRLTLPATAPIPREIAGCFDRSRGYGPNLVATGPFTIEGSDDLDPTSCDSLTPAPGFDPSKHLSLVRNPDYDPATDDPGIRDPGFDRYRFSIEEDPTKTLTRLEKGRVDLSTGDVGIDTLRRYVSDPKLRKRLHVEQDDRLWYLAMNLTEPPFDDLHVRRAVNLVMDKDLLQRAWGGAIQGEIATHILPDSLVDEPGLDPYASHHHEGDVAAARREMRRSRYDHDDDGRCDAAVCRGVLHVTRTDGQWESLDDVVTESLAKIGIELDTRVPDDPYGYITTARSPMAITSLPSWVKDYPDPFAILGFLMSGANITATDNYNYSLVGLTKATAERLHVAYPRGGVPSVDAEIARCESILVNSDRQTCWSALDRRVMLDVAPWVPYLSATRRIITSDRVEFVFDGAAGEVSFAHLGLRSP